MIRKYRSLRLWRITTTKAALRPWHRTNRFLEFWRASARYVSGQRPDLVVSSDLPGLVGASIAARRLGRPHLHDCHELYLESTTLRPFERRLLAPVERRYLRAADSVVVVNRTIRDEYEHRYGVRGVVVRNCAPAVGPGIEQVDLRAILGLPARSKLVLYQGGFVAGRGLELCVEAASGFPADTHLVLLGYGPLEQVLRERAGALGVADRVHLLPAVPPEELLSYTAAASIGLIPYQPVSRNNLYALPNKVFEYTGVGIPFVASDLPELRNIVQEWGCGRVYDPFDAGDLAAAVTEVLNPARYDSYQRAAREFGLQNSWESEKLILTAEMLRLAPALGSPRSASSSADSSS